MELSVNSALLPQFNSNNHNFIFVRLGIAVKEQFINIGAKWSNLHHRKCKRCKPL